jgi:hypothetical protein
MIIRDVEEDVRFASDSFDGSHERSLITCQALCLIAMLSLGDALRIGL